jgi:hypothetical protein
MTNHPAPLLSLIIGARNDSYMGDFKWRLNTCLNYLADSLERIGRSSDVEVVICDWGSPTALHTELDLSQAACDLTRFIVVPPEFAAMAQLDSPFPIPIVQNVAIRRAQGTYIAQTDSDILFTPQALKALFDVIDPATPALHRVDISGTLMVASRQHVPYALQERRPSLDEMKHFLDLNGSFLHREQFIPGYATPSGMALAHRDIWRESQGYDERLIYWGWMEIDLYLRFSKRYPWIDMASLGVNLYHLEHYPNRSPGQQARKSNPMEVPTSFQANSSDWGFNRNSFPEARASVLPKSPLPEELLPAEGLLSAVCSSQAVHQVQEQMQQQVSGELWDLFLRLDPQLQAALQPAAGQWNYHNALCWFATGNRPAVVVAVNPSFNVGIFDLLAGCSTSTLYVLDSWQHGAVAPHFPAPGVIADTAPLLGHNGHVEYLSDPATPSLAALLGRLQQEIDLVLIDNSEALDFPQELLDRLVTRMAPRGAIIIANDRGISGAIALNSPKLVHISCGSSSVLYKNPGCDAPKKASELDNIIAPEIRNDELYNLIIGLTRSENLSSVLEIGSSAGGGSTEAFVTGLAGNPGTPKLFCMEVSQPRFKELQARYASESFVKCYHTSSVQLANFATPAQVAAFYQSTQTNLNYYPLPQILGWLQQDIDYVTSSGLDEDGISRIRRENGIEHFDMVLIDGSEFTGPSELDRVYGARWLLLDDVNAFKNYQNYHRLRNDPCYELYRENWQLRNGYAVFKKKCDELPVHFFTIVLNGMPFVRYHIDVLRELPFKWHWHVVEGVADLVHDTAWSKQMGGHIPEMCHRDGLSLDGTSGYLDELVAQFPDQITVYRKPKGHFWDGKLEMVQAPVAALTEECLLWQVDVDEFWTAGQIATARRMFIENPDKTAAYYWCHFFVGERLVVNSRNCYSQNPAMEWLRTWRYTPGDQWIAHEPPRLHRPLPDGSSCDLSRMKPFLHDQTEALGLVFQHFAYVLPEQLRFKESYYGYRGALACWQRLQEQKNFPVQLRDFFPWVGDHTSVVPVEVQRVVPIKLPAAVAQAKRKLPVTVVDGVFFQMNNTGIARLWRSILCEWAKTEFGRSILVLDRMGTAPRIPGLRYRNVPGYDHQPQGWDRTMLQQVCTEEGADLFMSTYYTTPLSTPSVFLAYDMIPEFTNFYDLSDAQWQEKHHAIQRSSAVIAISRSTANDLGKLYPELAGRVAVAHCGLDREQFYPASAAEIRQLRERHGIDKPYFLFVGSRNGYKNGKLLLEAFTRLPDKHNYLLLYVGGNPELEPSFRALAGDADVRVVPLNDAELRVAYSGALAFVYPSMYEGFGLPVLEAMGCGCPVITCQNSSLPEVAGGAALFVSPEDPEQLATALHQIQSPEVRQGLIGMGSRQALKFTWKNMAGIMEGVIRSQGNSASA